MAQLDLSVLVAKIQEAETALPGFCDKAITAITNAESNAIGNFILKHLGIADPKSAEDEIIAGLKFVKAVAAQGATFVDPFLKMLVSLKPAPPPA